MKRVRLTTHQAVLQRLLKQPSFRQGYARELQKLAKLAQEPGGKTFSSMEALLRDLKRR